MGVTGKSGCSILNGCKHQSMGAAEQWLLVTYAVKVKDECSLPWLKAVVRSVHPEPARSVILVVAFLLNVV